MLKFGFLGLQFYDRSFTEQFARISQRFLRIDCQFQSSDCARCNGFLFQIASLFFKLKRVAVVFGYCQLGLVHKGF